MARHLFASLVLMGAACTSILDFDGYDYAVTGPASGTGAGSSVTSMSASTGTSAGGETSAGGSTSTNASAGGNGPGSGGMGGSGGGLKPNGEPCNEDYECLSGDCKNDVCCDSECEGICEACDVAGNEGTCTNVPAGQDPHDDCILPATCNGMGMCQ